MVPSSTTPVMLLVSIFFLCCISPLSSIPPQTTAQRQPECVPSSGDPDGDDYLFSRTGVDYPTFGEIPSTTFNCPAHLPGIFADKETGCQVYHMCLHSGSRHSFLCPNGTLFNQPYFVCDLWFNVQCERAGQFYSLNEHIYKDPVQLSHALNSKAS